MSNTSNTKLLRYFIQLATLLVAFACGKEQKGETELAGGGTAGKPIDPEDPRAEQCTAQACAAEDRRCDPTQGCVDCLFDTDCSEGSSCEDRACIPELTCALDEECSDKKPVCDPLRGRCVECSEDQDCGSKERCLEQRCEPSDGCVNSRDCDGGKVCDRTQAQCVECVADADCTEDALCVDSICEKSCDSDNDCREQGELCNRQLGFCSECVEDVDCADVYHCASGRCQLDVCEQALASCTSNKGGALSCSDSGDELSYVDCPFGSSCFEVGDFTDCLQWVCEPARVFCNAAGTAVETCSEDGLSVVLEEPCSDETVCVGSECLLKLCKPNEQFCQTNSVRQCDGTGLNFTILSQCTVTEFCEEAGTESRCVAQVCTPNRKSCQSNAAVQCLPDGSGFGEERTECEKDEICLTGECVAKICDPNRELCINGDVYACNSTGTATQKVTDCNGIASLCAVDGTQASCVPPLCEAGDKRCNAAGDHLQVCAEDLLSFVDDQECPDGQACSASSCKAVICEGSSFCDGNQLSACVDNGTRVQAVNACPEGQFCQQMGTQAQCAPQVCIPGASVCMGDELKECAADGSGLATLVKDCAQAGQACVANACLDVICEPDSFFCADGNSVSCGPKGVTSTVNDTCREAEYCAEGERFCQPDICTAGEPSCDGTKTATCNTDGSGVEPGAVECPAGNACDPASAACAPVVCEAESLFCDDEQQSLFTCNATGTSSSSTQTCPASLYCDAELGICARDVCVAGTRICEAETAATCNAAGSGPEPGSTPCAGTEVCTLGAESCAPFAEDAVGWLNFRQEYVGTDLLAGNFYEVATARRLTGIRQRRTVSGTRVFRWLVYVFDDNNGNYRLLSETVASQAGSVDQTQASGELNVELEAGRKYFIGLLVSGSTTVFHRDEKAKLSFASLIGGRQLADAVATPAVLSSASGSSYTQTVITARPSE